MTERIGDIVMCDNCVHKHYTKVAARKLYFCVMKNYEVFNTVEYCEDYKGFRRDNERRN